MKTLPSVEMEKIKTKQNTQKTENQKTVSTTSRTNGGNKLLRLDLG